MRQGQLAIKDSQIDDLEDTEIVQTEMVWNKYLDKDIFELSNE